MIQKPIDFYKQLHANFPFLATEKQDVMLKLLSIFIFETDKESLFLLKGYAGTGKTTVISTFVNTLQFAGKKAVLLAPTGRAAKVISVYSQRPAFTIHKKIYFPKKEKTLLFQKAFLTPFRYKYIKGYFQNEKYFEDIRPILLKQIMLKSL